MSAEPTQRPALLEARRALARRPSSGTWDSRRIRTELAEGLARQDGEQTAQCGPTSAHAQTQHKSLGAMQDFPAMQAFTVTANHESLNL